MSLAASLIPRLSVPRRGPALLSLLLGVLARTLGGSWTLMGGGKCYNFFFFFFSKRRNLKFTVRLPFLYVPHSEQ